MPLAVERGNVILHDGPVAPVALGREHVEVVVAAVRLAVALVEPVLAKLLAALGTEEVLRVPGLLERRDAFLESKLSRYEELYRRRHPVLCRTTKHRASPPEQSFSLHPKSDRCSTRTAD